MSPEISVYMHTVGCAKNLVDSEILLGQLAGRVHLVDEGAQADLLVVNTCGFIDAARVESIDAVMEAVELKKEHAGRRVVVMGCLSERYREEIRREIPELDGVYGVGEFGTMLRDMGLKPSAAGRDNLELFTGRTLLSPRHSAYLRISDGCDQRCTYCSIPLMRGRMRSRSVEDLVAEASHLASRGVKELNIIGQEISSYGRDTKGPDINDLLAALNGCGIEWIRLLYSHPPLVDERFAQSMADLDHVLPYLDFPVEHVSGRVLKRMARRGDAESLSQTMRMLRSRVPGLILRTSIILGFPGEGEAEFQELLDFCRSEPFDRLGAFLYSQEEGTPALKLDEQIPREVAEERMDRLMSQQAEISLAANQALVGQEDLILIDEVDEASGSSLGRSRRDALDIDNSVEVSGLHPVGEFLRVRYTEAMEYDLFAEPLDQGENS